MERDDVERRVLHAVGRAMGRFAMLRPGDRAAVGVSGGIRDFVGALGRRHPGVPESIATALDNVNPYTLFDPRLARDGADAPAFAPALDPETAAW